MRLLIKLSILITIVFCIFMLGGCTSEEPPEPKKAVTKKIPPPPKTTIAQVSSPSPTPSSNAPVPAKAEQAKAMPDAAKKTAPKQTPEPPSGDNQKKATHPSDKKAATPTAKVDAKPALPPKSVSNIDEKGKKDHSASTVQPDSPKVSTKPKDPSIEKIAPETDALQPPEEKKTDDSALADTEPEAPPLTTETQVTQNKRHAPDIKAITSQVEEQLEPKITISSYDPKGRIDPFVPFIKKPEPTKEPDPIVRKYKGPLQKVDIDQLQLVGIIRAPSGNLALVQQASGKGYIIQKGTPIGIKDGHVAEILADQVVVKEKGKDPYNVDITIERLMKIKKPIGEL